MLLQQDEVPKKGGRPSLSPPSTPVMPTKFALRLASLVVAGLVISVGTYTSLNLVRVVVRKVSLAAPASRAVRATKVGKVL